MGQPGVSIGLVFAPDPVVRKPSPQDFSSSRPLFPWPRSCENALHTGPSSRCSVLLGESGVWRVSGQTSALPKPSARTTTWCSRRFAATTSQSGASGRQLAACAFERKARRDAHTLPQLPAVAPSTPKRATNPLSPTTFPACFGSHFGQKECEVPAARCARPPSLRNGLLCLRSPLPDPKGTDMKLQMLSQPLGIVFPVACLRFPGAAAAAFGKGGTNRTVFDDVQGVFKVLSRGGNDSGADATSARRRLLGLLLVSGWGESREVRTFHRAARARALVQCRGDLHSA